MNLSLNGKNAMICGSTSGIGKAIALLFAASGASCTLVARNENALQSVLKELDTTSGQSHSYLAADFSHPHELEEKINPVKASRHFHILVNNTGGPPSGKMADAGIEEFRIAFNHHLVNNHILMQALLPGMKKEKFGRIINVISTSVKQPLPGLGVSNTVRAAVANWSKTLASELAPFGITVNNILPGATLTPRLQSIIETKAVSSGREIGQVREEMLEEIPMKRFADAAEVAAAAVFLASPQASYITGINIPVDGGRTLCL